jgi:hypothetical protein
MNLDDLNQGSPLDKPWLNPVCATLTCENISASKASSASSWKPGGTIPQLVNASNINVAAADFVGGFGLVTGSGTGTISSPSGAALDAYLPGSVAGASFVFTVINGSLAVPPAVVPRIVGPDGAILQIPPGLSGRANSTAFLFQKQVGGAWTCLNQL